MDGPAVYAIGSGITKAALSANPWQLGKNKLLEVVNAIKESYNYDIKPRTAKERVDLLVMKLKKEELQSKTGTEEQKVERVDLLQEIISLMEQEEVPIIKELGPDTGIVSTNRKQERINADRERDDLLIAQTAISSPSIVPSTVVNLCTNTATTSSAHIASTEDAAPSPNRIRMKRTRAARENDMILKRHMHDIDMERRKQQLQEDVENKRMELEVMREKRLAEELQRKEEARIEKHKRECEKDERDKTLLLAITNLITFVHQNQNNSGNK